MRIATIEAWSGAAGDMFLGALAGAGLDMARLEAEIRKVVPEGWAMSVSEVRRAGQSGTRVSIETGAPAGGPGGHRHLAEILGMIDKAGLSAHASALCSGAFETLAAAEAKVHGCDVMDVHFHELGEIDSIVDIAGTMIGYDMLGITETWCPGVCTGWGTVSCAHGELPVPAPVTSVLLEGIPVVSGSVKAEMTTPTGAVLLTTLVDHWTPPPPAIWDSAGLGAGASDHPSPNLLRIRLGTPGVPCCPRMDEAVELVTLLDDMDPRLFPRLQEAVMAAGAVDCYAAHCTGRKGRPAVEITVVCRAEALEASIDALLRNSTTLGVRIRSAGFRTLDRSFIEVSTPWGTARLRAGVAGRRYVNVNPDFSDCEDLARRAGLPVRVVLDRLKTMASELEGREGGGDAGDP